MTTSNIPTESLITEFHSLTTESFLNLYRRGEIVLLLSTDNGVSLQQAGDILGISKSTALRLAQTTEFANEVPMIDPVEVISKVGTHNIRWLSTKSRVAQKEEIQIMVNDEEPVDAIQSRIAEMKESCKAPAKPSKVQQLEEELEWYKQALHNTMVANEAATELVGKLLDELEETDCRTVGTTPVVEEQHVSEIGKELQQAVQAVWETTGKEETQHEESITTMEVTEQETIENIQEELPTIQEEKVEDDPLAFLNRPTNALARFRNAQPKEEEVVTRPAWLGFETDNDAFTETYA